MSPAVCQSQNDQAYDGEALNLGVNFYEKHGVWGEQFSTL